MTDQQAALGLVVHSSFSDAGQQLLTNFYDQWKHEALVVNQWLAVQASDVKAGALARVQALMEHEAFDLKNPNKVRSVISVFCNQNLMNFHQQDGSGYGFLADQVIAFNRINPQIASRLLTPLTRWRKYDADRQQLMKAELERIMASGDLSKDVYEVVSKSLAAS